MVTFLFNIIVNAFVDKISLLFFFFFIDINFIISLLIKIGRRKKLRKFCKSLKKNFFKRKRKRENVKCDLREQKKCKLRGWNVKTESRVTLTMWWVYLRKTLTKLSREMKRTTFSSKTQNWMRGSELKKERKMRSQFSFYLLLAC